MLWKEGLNEKRKNKKKDKEIENQIHEIRILLNCIRVSELSPHAQPTDLKLNDQALGNAAKFK